MFLNGRERDNHCVEDRRNGRLNGRFGETERSVEGHTPPRMKGKDIKSWVMNKRASFAEARQNSRQAQLRDSDKVDMQDGKKKTSRVSGEYFCVDQRYKLIKVLGRGAYGVVCSANDEKLNGSKVAVKKIANVFDDLTDAKRIIREIRLMKMMKHENILGILNMDNPSNYHTFNDVYIVTQLMDTDMNKLLRSKHPLVEKQIKYFVYQICRAMKYIHTANILHRDLKPSNILISATVSYPPHTNKQTNIPFAC